MSRTSLKLTCSKFEQFTSEHSNVFGWKLWTMTANGYIGSLWYPTTVVSMMNYTALFGDMFLEDQDEAR